MESVRVRDISFQDLEHLQNSLLTKVQADKNGVLLFSEPRPTYTCGRLASDAGLLWEKSELEKRGVATFKVDRGGKWTYHGPGQLVVYPILYLPSFGLKTRAVRHYLELLRSGISSFLHSLQIETDAPQETRPFGIYVNQRKLISFGISVHRGVTKHGFSLYLQKQEAAFRGINPCGVANEKLTSLEELGIQVDWEESSRNLERYLENTFRNLKT